MEDALNFSLGKSTPLILQTEMAECGLASLAMVAGFFGHKLDLPAMRKRFRAELKGMNLQQLIDVADGLGFASSPLQCSIDELHKLQTPCILHWDMNHFVVLTKISNHKKHPVFSINDPASGRRNYTLAEFSQHYTGICLELTPTNKFEAKKETAQMRLSQLWSSITGLKSGLVKLIALSIVLQLIA